MRQPCAGAQSGGVASTTQGMRDRTPSAARRAQRFPVFHARLLGLAAGRCRSEVRHGPDASAPDRRDSLPQRMHDGCHACGCNKSNVNGRPVRRALNCSAAHRCHGISPERIEFRHGWTHRHWRPARSAPGLRRMRITGEGIWGEPADPGEARHVLQRAIELGILFFDTADSYGPEDQRNPDRRGIASVPGRHAHRDQGRHRAARPADLGNATVARSICGPHARPACDACRSTASISTSCMPLIRACHWKIRSANSRACKQRGQDPAHRRLERHASTSLARARRMVEVVSVQNRYNVADRSSDDVLAVCERDGLAFIPWSPLVQSPQDAGVATACCPATDGRESRKLTRAPGGHRLVAGPVAGDAADSRHYESRSPRVEYCRRTGNSGVCRRSSRALA